MQAQGGSARLAAGIAHHYLSAGDQPAAFAAAVRAGRQGRRGPRPRRGGHACTSARCSCGRACPTPRRWRASTTPRCCAGPPTPHNDKPRAEALYEAALSEIDETAEPYRAADLLEHLANVRWGLGAAERSLATLERGLALLPDRRRAAPSARCCSACGRSSSCCAGATAAPSRRRAAALDARRGRRRARRAQPRAQRHGHLAHGPRRGRPGRGQAARGARPRRRAPAACPRSRAAYINLADLLHQRGRSEEAPRRRPRGRRAHDGHRRLQLVGQHRRGRDRARHRRLGLRRAPPARSRARSPAPRS